MAQSLSMGWGRTGLLLGPWSRTMKEGLLPWSNFHGLVSLKIILQSFGTFTRCKLNVDQEEWPSIKKGMVYLFSSFYRYMSKKNNIEMIKAWPPFFVFSSPPKQNHFLLYQYLYTMGPCLLFTRAHLLPLPPQNMLDHVNGCCRP